ncbi:MAG: hypothetical protein ACYC28_08845 [Longimicrobiales bacterium]
MNPAVTWAVVGLVLVLGKAAYSLGIRGVAVIAAGLTTLEWAVLLVLTVLFAVGEGWYALARRWVPHALRRAESLRRESRLLPRLLAPLHAMSLVYVPRSTALRAWGGVVAITLAVVIVRSFPEPWRGIVDFAVASALSIGVVAIPVQARRLHSR